MTLKHKHRAWAIYVHGFGQEGWGSEPYVITIARTRPQAIARNLFCAHEAGYRFAWTDFKAVRAPEYDVLIERQGIFSWTLLVAQYALEQFTSGRAAPQSPPACPGSSDRT